MTNVELYRRLAGQDFLTLEIRATVCVCVCVVQFFEESFENSIFQFYVAISQSARDGEVSKQKFGAFF